MNEIGKRIQKAMSIRNMRQADIIEKTGINKGSLSSYIAGRYSPKQNNIYLLAKALNVNEAWLMGADVPMERTNVVPLEHPYGRYLIPVLTTVAAGKPIYAEEDVIEWIDYDKDPGNHVRACRIDGSSMIPRIQSGDTVIFDTELGWEDGDVIIATVNGDHATCKRIKKYSDGLALLSDNSNVSPMYFSRQEVEELPVTVVGRVIEVRGKL